MLSCCYMIYDLGPGVKPQDDKRRGVTWVLGSSPRMTNWYLIKIYIYAILTVDVLLEKLL